MSQQTDKAYGPSILILSSAESSDNIAINDAFVTELNQLVDGKCHIEWHNYHNLGIRLRQNKLDAFLVSDDRPISTFRAVYFKSYFRYHEVATAIADVLDSKAIRLVGHELREYIPAYKLSQMSRLARAGLPIPDTLYLPIEHYLDRFDEIAAEFGVPFIFKAIDGMTGNDNYLVKDKIGFGHLLQNNSGRHFIVQRFIANTSDMRVLILDGEIRLIIERQRKNNDTHLNNTSKGASSRLISVNELPLPLRDLSLQASKIMKRDIAGVDLMIESGTGYPYILEVNASPQIGSGAFEYQKLAIYADFFPRLVA